VDFAEALRVGEHLATLRGEHLFIHFRPLANPGPTGPSWS
jgi:hypothetical protein